MSGSTFVVGTAGHVDHGKSSLVRALTGTDPDRLAEEQRRQMTIDLGFAELVTPAGNHVHLVDVPGHERFVRNMLAGVGGIDAAMLVIAADDGPMPQTLEHLAILDLLGIERGVVALSKIDLVDQDWSAFVQESIRELIDGTALATAEIVPVSPQSGEGLDALTAALDRVLAGARRESPSHIARLSIDRVFTMAGFGVVVTGTLLGGDLAVGDRVDILPRGIHARIRGLQTFGAATNQVTPGSRVAVNLSGVETAALQRGDLLAAPERINPSMRFDARLKLLPDSERPLRSNDEVVVFAGAAELPARVAILEAEMLAPDAAGWVQFRLGRPIAAVTGDRFIVRRPSPPETIGGGTIVELDPPRHKRHQVGVIERLDRLAAGDPAEQLYAWMGDRIVERSELDRLGANRDTTDAAIAALLADGRVESLGAQFLARAHTVEHARSSLLARINAYHLEHPVEVGIGREQLRETSSLARGPFDAVIHWLAETDAIEQIGPLIRRTGFRIELSPEQQRRSADFLVTIDHEGFQPSMPGDRGVDIELVRAMSHLGMIVEIGDDIVFTPARLKEAEARLMRFAAVNQSISLAEYRDELDTTRKYAQALLEYFDRQRLTRRVGDRRVVIHAARHIEDTTHP